MIRSSAIPPHKPTSVSGKPATANVRLVKYNSRHQPPNITPTSKDNDKSYIKTPAPAKQLDITKLKAAYAETPYVTNASAPDTLKLIELLILGTGRSPSRRIPSSRRR